MGSDFLVLESFAKKKAGRCDNEKKSSYGLGASDHVDCFNSSHGCTRDGKPPANAVDYES